MELDFNYLWNSEEYKNFKPYWPFENEAEFNALFGMRNGTRMNKILLSFITSQSVYNYSPRWLTISSMQNLKKNCMIQLRNYEGALMLAGNTYFLDGYSTDERLGICADGDLNAIRFWHDGRVAKMRSGKLFRKIILAHEFGRILPEQVVTWLCEEFASTWNAYASERTGANYMLVTGLDSDLTFSDIYGDGSYSADGFGSCMTGQKRGAFYEKCMKDVYPAALVRKNDPKSIVARCVVYNHVVDTESGAVYRLAERQYTCEDDSTKRLLVNALEKAGLIDGHKAVGASCHDGWNFVLNDGTPINDKKLSVDVDFSKCKTLSYQDSFKWYNNDVHKAYNFRPSKWQLELNVTSPRVSIYMDTYHNKEVIGCRVANVWVDGKEMTCAVRDIDDFLYWQDNYYHREKDTVACPHCGGKMGAHHAPSWCVSELLGKSYCSSQCKHDAELAAGEVELFFSVFDDTYVKKASELTTAMVYCIKYEEYRGYVRGYRKMSIMKSSLEAFMLIGDAVKYQGKHYVNIHRGVNVPYGAENGGKPAMI